MPEQKRRCPDCGETRSLADFYSRIGAGRGAVPQKPSDCSAYCKACARERYHANSKRIQARRVTRVFGLREEQYEALLAAQGGGCGICGRAERSARFKRLAVDHCHATGRIRGLLCQRCNIAIGLLDDSIPQVRAVLAYLSREPPNVGRLERKLTRKPYLMGTANPQTKLDSDGLMRIVELRRQGLTHRDIAAALGVDHSTVGRFLRQQTRKAAGITTH